MRRRSDRGFIVNRRVKTVELSVRIAAISIPPARPPLLPVQVGVSGIVAGPSQNDEILLVGVGVRRRVRRMNNWRPQAALRRAIVPMFVLTFFLINFWLFFGKR